MNDVLALLEVPAIEIQKKLFALRDFDFIAITDRGTNYKQAEALEALLSGNYTEILYGGAAGGAKSWTGAAWLTFMCECYPGTRWFIGRDALNKIKESTLVTLMKVFRAYGIEGAKYIEKDNCILFPNASRIDFLDLKFYPQDKLYERFGSLEFTGGWIEEAGEVHFGAFDVLKTRIGRHMNDKYGLKPVLFITCNPKKNWLYYEFFVPWKTKTLDAKKKFIQAFIQDNPAIESGYLQQLQSQKSVAQKERLLNGNWDYDDDPTTLCDFDSILDAFTNDFVSDGEKRISADLAMKGRDKFIAGAWSGLIVRVAIDKAISTGAEIEADLKKLMITEQVPRSRTVVDSDGLGSYLESYLVGIKEFHGGAVADDSKEYGNLKSECGYKLAEVFNKRLIKIICTEEQKQLIIEEMGVLKAKDIDADEKRKQIIKKEDMKILLGRSPDYLDMLLMGMIFYKGTQKSNLKSQLGNFR